MTFHSGQQLVLLDGESRRLGEVTVERVEDDLLFAGFRAGPDFATMERLFRAFEEAVGMQALKRVDALDVEIASLKLHLATADGGDMVPVHDVQIWNDGEMTCRLPPVVASGVEEVEEPTALPAVGDKPATPLASPPMRLTVAEEGIRQRLVSVALEWERRFSVAPDITRAVSEYDAACLVGHTDDSFAADCVGRTAVTPGADFTHDGVRYQIKANRPSGKPGSAVRKVPKAESFEWDRLVWLLYDPHYVLQEAWEWEVRDYRDAFETKARITPADMRRGRKLYSRAAA